MRLCRTLLINATVCAIGTTCVESTCTAEDWSQREELLQKVDTAAFSFQYKSIQVLETLLQSRKQLSTAEADLLIRISEEYHTLARIEFRRLKGEQAQDTRNHLLTKSLRHLKNFRSSFPGHALYSRATYLLGKAYAELNDATKARGYFSEIMERFPETLEGSLSHFLLCDLQLKAADFSGVLRTFGLKPIAESNPTYVRFLSHVSWAHYSLKDPTSALRVLEQEIHFLRRTEPLTVAPKLKNASLYYAYGTLNGLPGYEVSRSLEAFRKFSNQPEELRQLVLDYGYELRTKDRRAELDQLLALVLKNVDQNLLGRDAGSDMLLLVMDFNLSHRRFDAIRAQAPKLISLASLTTGRAATRARNFFLNVIKVAQEDFKSAKGPSELKAPGVFLVDFASLLSSQTLFDSLTRQSLQVNVAEIAFKLGNTEQAAQAYRQAASTQADALRKSQLELKAISARYETLKRQELIPAEIQAQSLQVGQTSARALPTLFPALFKEWQEWLASYTPLSSDIPSKELLLDYQLDSIRTIYSMGDLQQALRLAQEFAIAQPRAPQSQAALALVLDTYIVSEDWASVIKLTRGWLVAQGSTLSPTLKARFEKASGDASAEEMVSAFNAKLYVPAKELALKLLSEYPEHPSAATALKIAAKSSLLEGDLSKGLDYYHTLAAKSPKQLDSAAQLEMTLAEAAFAEESGDLLGTVNFLRKATQSRLDSGVALDAASVKKLLLYSLATERLAEMNVWLKDKKFCDAALAGDGECTHFSQLLAAAQPEVKDADQAWKRYKATKKSDPKAALLRLLSAMTPNWERKYTLNETLDALQFVFLRWSTLPKIEQHYLWSRILPRLQGGVESVSEKILKSNPIRGIESVPQYLGAIEAAQSVLAQAKNLPEVSVSSIFQRQIALAFQGLKGALQNIRAPRGLTQTDEAAFFEQVKLVSQSIDGKIAAQLGFLASSTQVEGATKNTLLEDLEASLQALQSKKESPLHIQAAKALQSGRPMVCLILIEKARLFEQGEQKVAIARGVQ